MKNFKLLSAFLMMSILFTFCSDPCKDIECINGDCDEGICNCTLGYEGTTCDSEIRTKYYGIYMGDFGSCIPDIAGGIDLEQFSAFTSATLIIGPATAVHQVNISSTNTLFSFSQNADITAQAFPIDATTTTIDDPNLLPIAINISSAGFGEFIDENTLSLDLLITITPEGIPLPFSQSCTIEFTKQ